MCSWWPKTPFLNILTSKHAEFINPDRPFTRKEANELKTWLAASLKEHTQVVGTHPMMRVNSRGGWKSRLSALSFGTWSAVTPKRNCWRSVVWNLWSEHCLSCRANKHGLLISSADLITCGWWTGLDWCFTDAVVCWDRENWARGPELIHLASCCDFNHT